MPKDRRLNSSSFDRAMMSPYACSLKISDHTHTENHLYPVGDESEWEEARCPICMEHPHNAVLLVCSSQEKGCRPFMCDTSYRHSNCLDQFLKSSAAASLPFQSEEDHTELLCPLCRGVVTRWVVVDAARTFMNAKTRNCSLETCDFTGNYSELRKHARVEHPCSRPSQASPTRQSNWAELERQRELEDVLAQQYYMDYEWDELPSFDGWREDDLWSDESFFDFPSGMSDVEDDMIDDILGIDGISFSFVELYLSSPEEETMDSGSSGSSDTHGIRTTSTNPRTNSLVENPSPSSRSRSSHQRENGPTRARSRSSHPRENGSTNSRTGSSHHRDNGSNNSRSRSSFRRENGSGYLRTGSDHHRETGSMYSGSRSTNRMETAPARFTTRSNYARRDGLRNSRERSRYLDTRDSPRTRWTAPRRDFPSYQRQPR